MSELLHVGALVPAVLCTGALVRDRRLRPTPEVVASILMLIGMADAMLWHVVSPVYWSAALVVVALGLVVGRRRGVLARGRPSAAHDARAHVALTAHVALGLVVMAALIVAGATRDPAASTVDGHCHSYGGGIDGIRLMTLVLCGGYVLLTAWCSRSARHRSGGRLHYWMMAVSTVAMGAMTLV